MTGWPDIEKFYVAYLGTALSVRVATQIPDDVEELSGFVRVTRGPGGADRISDEPLLDIEAFHVKRPEAGELAEEARQAVLGSVNKTGTLVDRADTATGPNWVFYGPHVERYVASYRLSLRRPR